MRALVTLLLLDVLTESWFGALWGTGRLALAKNVLYLALLVATIVRVGLGRTWRAFTAPADVAILVLIGLLAASAVSGQVAPVVAGQGGYLYLRGAIVFYALRALTVDQRWIRWLIGICLGWACLNCVLAIAQVAFGRALYTALGWRDLEMADIHRAQGLYGHPNDLGHLLGLTIIGVLAWVSVRGQKRPLWLVLGLAALLLAGLAATSSRESMFAAIGGIMVVAVLARIRWRRVAAVVAIVAVSAAAPMLALPGNRTEVMRRATGLGISLGIPLPPPPADLSQPICGPPPPVHTERGSACRNALPDQEIRVVYARQGVPLWRARPVLGYGPGTFGGIVALQTDPSWNRNPRFAPGGFDLHGFAGKTVDSFWLHLVIELGTAGLLAYLAWLWLLCGPLRRTRADPIVLFGPAAVIFVVITGVFSLSPEGPFVPVLLFGALGLAWQRSVPPVGADRPPIPRPRAAVGLDRTAWKSDAVT